MNDECARDVVDDGDDDVAFWARFSLIVDTAFRALSPVDRAAGVAWCRKTGLHGIRVEEADADGSAVRLMWGGRPLAVVERSVFADDAYLDGLSFTALPIAPDDASNLSADDL